MKPLSFALTLAATLGLPALLFAAQVPPGSAPSTAPDARTLEELVAELSGTELPATGLAERYTEVLTRLLPLLTETDPAQQEAALHHMERITLTAGRPGAIEQRGVWIQALLHELAGDRPVAVRVALLRQLEWVAGAESNQPLATMLAASEPEVRTAALRALTSGANRGARTVLAQALMSATDVPSRIALLQALAETDALEAADLIGVFAVAEDATLAELAVAALGSLGTREACEALAELEEFVPPERRRAIYTAHVEAATKLATMDPETAYTHLLALNPRLTDPALRCAGLRGLAKAGRAAAIETLLAVLQEPEVAAAVAATVAQTLAELEDAEGPAALCATLGELPARVQPFALAAIETQRLTMAQPAVLELLRSAASQVRLAAIDTLIVVGDVAALSHLLRLAAGASGDEQTAADRALGRIRDPQIDQQLLGILSGEMSTPLAPETYAAVCRALAARRTAGAVPILLETVSLSPEHLVRMAAYRALAELADTRHLPTLLPYVLSTTDEAERNAGEETLAALTGRGDDPDPTPLLVAWDTVDSAGRVTLLRVLGRMGGNTALARVEAALEDEEETVFDAAVRVLAVWSESAALNTLGRLGFDAHPRASRTHRILCQQGYVRLLATDRNRPPTEQFAALAEAFERVERVEERRQVLAALAGVFDPRTLPFVARLLDDAQLGREATAAAVTAAENVGHLERSVARHVLRQLADTATDDHLRTRAVRALATIDQQAGRLTRWEIAGPYWVDGLKAHEVAGHLFAPEDPAASEPVHWEPLQVRNRNAPWNFDLTHFGGEHRCVYVRTAVYVPTAQPARLEVGSDDMVHVWLNRESIHQTRGTRGHTPFEDAIAVTLQAGWNTVLLKVTQEGGGWAFSCAVRQPDGGPLEGEDYATVPPVEATPD